MIAGLAFLGDKLRTPSRPVEILILGGGTGSLSQFITDHFANVRITNIELCEDMLLIAKRFFNFTPTADQKMLCCDALNYVD
jgi:spermidine synthase